jgi:hypothetical protein
MICAPLTSSLPLQWSPFRSVLISWPIFAFGLLAHRSQHLRRQAQVEQRVDGNARSRR